jgi:hypothetical protein
VRSRIRVIRSIPARTLHKVGLSNLHLAYRGEPSLRTVSGAPSVPPTIRHSPAELPALRGLAPPLPRRPASGWRGWPPRSWSARWVPFTARLVAGRPGCRFRRARPGRPACTVDTRAAADAPAAGAHRPEERDNPEPTPAPATDRSHGRAPSAALSASARCLSPRKQTTRHHTRTVRSSPCLAAAARASARNPKGPPGIALALRAGVISSCCGSGRW